MLQKKKCTHPCTYDYKITDIQKKVYWLYRTFIKLNKIVFVVSIIFVGTWFEAFLKRLSMSNGHIGDRALVLVVSEKGYCTNHSNLGPS
jgi:hypothetical protein